MLLIFEGSKDFNRNNRHRKKNYITKFKRITTYYKKNQNNLDIVAKTNPKNIRILSCTIQEQNRK